MTSQVGLDGRRLGPVTVILGASGGVFPHCVSLLVDGGTEKAVIDPGADAEALRRWAPVVTRILNTHYHFDHIHGNRLFPNATAKAFPRSASRTTASSTRPAITSTPGSGCGTP